MKIKSNSKALYNLKKRQRNFILLISFVCVSATAVIILAVGTLAIKLGGV